MLTLVLLTCCGLFLEYKCFAVMIHSSSWAPYLVIMLIILVTYFTILLILQPYIFTWKYSFYRKDRWIYRISYIDDLHSDIYTDLKVVKKFFCSIFAYTLIIKIEKDI